MPLWISLYLPTHSLDVLFPQWPTNTPLAAVLHKEQVCAVTPAARALGVQIGMPRSSVLGLAPRAQLCEYNALQDAQNLKQVALGLLQYTPNITLFGSCSVLLEVSASLSLFNGPRNLWRLFNATLSNLVLNARAGMAPTAQGAWLLAYQTQTRQRRVLKKHKLASRLDPLPVTTLPAAQHYLGWLSGIGCRSLKQLRQLPRKGLQQRSGLDLIQSLDAAYGQVNENFTWFEAPDTFSQRYEPAERLEHTNSVFIIAQKLIEQLCGWLQVKHYATHTLVFELHHEKGRHARPPTCFTLTLSQVRWKPDDFLTVLNEQLQPLTLNAPVIAIQLSVSYVESRPSLSDSLFPEPTQFLAQEHQLLDLLRARLGAENVLQAQPRADHRPEYANTWQPVHTTSIKTSTALASQPPALSPYSRPFWLLPSPLKLATQNDRPVYKGAALHLLQGPERIESGWWGASGHEQRDYFIAEDSRAIRYWVYRERQSLDASWFLHGLFG